MHIATVQGCCYSPWSTDSKRGEDIPFWHAHKVTPGTSALLMVIMMEIYAKKTYADKVNQFSQRNLNHYQKATVFCPSSSELVANQ